MSDYSDINYSNAGWRQYGKISTLPFARPNWEFQIIIEGSCRVQLVNRRWINAEEGSFWLFRPGFPHGWSNPDEEAQCRIAVLHITGVPSVVKHWMDTKNYFHTVLSGSELHNLDARMAEIPLISDLPTPLRQLRVEALVLEMSYIFLQSQASDLKETESRDTRLVQQSLNWMAGHLHEGCGVKDVAQAMNRSPQHLRRIFQQETGRRPSQELARMRISRAKELLAMEDYTLEVISDAVGLSCAASLSRAFKMETGMTPRSFKQKTAKK